MKINAIIKIGASIGQDFSYDRWPNCVPPRSEYEGEEYNYITKFPMAIFECEWNSQGNRWDCVRDGYGKSGNYGNGSISVFGYYSVEPIDLKDESVFW
jgi:hypothetical protein